MFDTSFDSLQKQTSIVLVTMQYLRKLSDSLTRVDNKYTAHEGAIWEQYGEVALNTLNWNPGDWCDFLALRRVGVHIDTRGQQIHSA